MENVNTNFSTFLNFVYKNIVCLSSNKIFFVWEIMEYCVIIFSDPDPESGRIFPISGPMINNLEAFFFFFKLEDRTIFHLLQFLSRIYIIQPYLP